MAGLTTVVGREHELRDLRAAFHSTNVQVLSGMGGVGKTSLARAYAQRHLADYGIVWWIRSEDPSAIDAEFRSLLEILLPPGEAAQVTNARTTAFALLAREHRPWLLILDNVPDAASAQGLLPPAGNGHILITTRATAWFHQTTVQPLDTHAAVELLTTQSGDFDRTAAETLAEELGGLPLALTQAAGFVRANALDLATYLRLYRDRGAELHLEGRPADYPHTVATTWQLAMDRLTEKTRELLNLIAFYAPDAIPVHLLLHSWDELARHRVIGELHSYGLVTPAGTGKITAHHLIQAVTRNRLHANSSLPDWADRARELVMSTMPKELTTSDGLAIWNLMRTHLHALLDHLPPEHADTFTVWHHVAAWTGQAGDRARARDLFAELLPVRERVLGAEHPDTLSTRHCVAFWTGHAGDRARARDLFAELLPIRERVLGAEHPVTLITLGNLAQMTGMAGDEAGARDLFAKLLPIQERVLGAEHPDTM
ncbi:MAG TPA: tetratricopeptide repeat protein, partial [Actinophytocola sp.]|uniref:tetratricopeptide repeat protein n=1 Tax=Actinophytocola sp. TaxID=1872138 RepID=UPI002DDD526D